MEAETGDLPTSLEQETDRDAATPIHRWKAEDKLRDWQDAAGQRMTEDIEEEAGWEIMTVRGFRDGIYRSITKLRLPAQEA